MTSASKAPQNIDPQLRSIAIYLMGYRDGSENDTPSMLPPFLRHHLREALDYCAAQDKVQREGAPLEAGDFEPWGKWHRAVNLLIWALDLKAQRITEATHEYPERIGSSDVLHKCLMNTQRSNHNEPIVY